MTEALKPLIELQSLTRCYTVGEGETIYALDAVDLSIAHNDYVAIVGSSGSGKSTMMNILGCLDSPTSGSYWLNSVLVSQLSENQLSEVRNRQIGFIFQNFNLLPRASTLKNVIQPLIYRPGSKKERIERAEHVLERVGLLHRKDHLPSELSGGQRQRVAIARALVTNPSLLLADEPTGNLDSVTTLEILKLFDTLHQEGQTVILVTHDQKVAQRCHSSVELQDGRVVSRS